MLRVAAATILVALAPPAGAQISCVAGGSASAPHDWHDPASWSPAQVPGASSDVALATDCWVRCGTGECHARNLKGSAAGGGLEIGPGAALVLHGCDQANSQNQTLFECGAQTGFRFVPRGAPVHDSSVGGDPIVRGASLPLRPDLIRLALSQSIAAAPGDWFQVRGGPRRGHVHRIDGVDFSACPDPAHCWMDLRVHDPDMEFGRNSQTQGLGTDLVYVGPAGDVRVAGPDHPLYKSADLAHCVEACGARSGDDCTAASTLERDSAYVGWYFGATPLGHPADPAAMGKRHLIVSTENDVAPRIGPGTGVVDRICFADPVTYSLAPVAGVSETSGVIWPGFWPGDAWVVFRPAVVRYAGDEIDGGLGFHGACLDADYAFFDDWGRIVATTGTPECQRPFQDTVITSHHEGVPSEIAHQAGGGGCNGQSIQIMSYSELAGDRVAIVDTRTPVDTSATCNPDGSGPFDGAIDSGHHGVAMTQTTFDEDDPPSGWLIRHAGDDGIILRSDELGSVTWTLRGWSWWYMTQGISGEVVDFGASAPGQTVRLEDASVVQWAGSTGCKGAIDDPYDNVTFEIDGMFYLDRRHEGSIVGNGAQFDHAVRDLLAWGPRSGSCGALRSGRLEDAWISGWNRLFNVYTSGVRGVRQAANGGSATGPILATLASNESVEIRDFILTSLPNTYLLNPVCIGCSLELRDGALDWAQVAPTWAVASFTGAANVPLAAPVEGLNVRHRALLRCGPTWYETGDHIGVNLLVDPPSGLPSVDTTGCPLASPQVRFAMTPPPTPAPPPRFEPHGQRFGPSGRVGLSAAQTLAARLDLESDFFVPAVGCSDGLDNDLDGFTDGRDAGCWSELDASEKASDLLCDDGLDNDGDGRIDVLVDRNGDGIPDAPGDAGCRRLINPENPSCQDGINNDPGQDGLIDFDGGAAAGLPPAQRTAPDPQCQTPSSREAGNNSSCGLGAEIAWLAMTGLWLRRRVQPGHSKDETDPARAGA